jgi:hypothetical protein
VTAPAIGPLESYFVGIPRDERRRRVFILLQAYVDESGTDERSKTFVFAGYIGLVDQFDEFSEGWRALLRQPRPISRLKFTEAINFKGPFRGWSEAERNEKILALSRFAFQNTGGSFSVIIVKKDWEEARKKFPRKVKHLDLWTLAIGHVFNAVLRYRAHFKIADRIHFIFDEKKIYSPIIQKMWPSYRESSAECRDALALSPPKFLSDDDIMPLQAADFKAGFVRSIWDARQDGKRSDDFGFSQVPWDAPSHAHYEFRVPRDDLYRVMLGSIYRFDKSKRSSR